jgi:MFS family permease
MAVRDQPCADCLDHALADERGRPRVPRRAAFCLLAGVLTVIMLGTTLPTPLYVIYQARWHFSAVIVTVTFAVYAAGVLTALLLAGRSSDQAGRKPVIATALGCSALSTVVIILAPDVGVLIIGRILSGLSAGLMTGTATATLTDLVPAAASRRASLVATAANMGGLGLGPLIAGLFAQYAPDPTVLVFEVYLALLVAAGLCLLLVPETVSPRHRPALRFTGLDIPEPGRDEFVAAGMAGFAAFSLLGLFTALAPTFAGDVLHESNHAIQGGVVFLMLAVGAMTQVVLFLAALALIVAALSSAGMGLFLAGTCGRGCRGRRLHGQPGHGQSAGPARAARPGHLHLLRVLLRRPDHPGHRRGSDLGVHRGLLVGAGLVYPARWPVRGLTVSYPARPVAWPLTGSVSVHDDIAGAQARTAR